MTIKTHTLEARILSNMRLMQGHLLIDGSEKETLSKIRNVKIWTTSSKSSERMKEK